ncbi:DNA-binding protein [Halobiforma lacisalsi AJ5]|uniref:DNA-binding protein n=1 Tax=Natronobacterium lacisalsi AJ5 TaxID=358396 RepID=M0L3M4_NATLA|nr:hypothetical protein [Halobiforma lacisalsi]APW98202.1 DNA-binding protein [Halobiforma lacisalsi AJ5]EMA28187.1 OB-fold tRNA/helicase-type nucleic acid binding protein [Halobiforma lacisalsi AJ5]
MRLAVRATVAVVLLAGVVGLCVHYGATYEENWPHPTGEQLDAEYDRHVDDQVLLFGEVQDVNPDETMEIHVTDSADEVVAELEVDVGSDPKGTTVDSPGTDSIRGKATPLDPSAVEPGGVVQVYGELEADRSMTADEVVVVNPGPDAATYKHGTSVLGILLAVGYFFRHWRLDGRRLGFEPRTAGKTERIGADVEPEQRPNGSRNG